jgi:hypothetical protein
MKRPRPAPTRVMVLPKEVHDLAKEKLAEDYLGFISNTHGEDPKSYVQRDAAARAAYEHLSLIRTDAGELEQAAPGPAETLIEARAGLAAEEDP